MTALLVTKHHALRSLILAQAQTPEGFSATLHRQDTDPALLKRVLGQLARTHIIFAGRGPGYVWSNFTTREARDAWVAQAPRRGGVASAPLTEITIDASKAKVSVYQSNFKPEPYVPDVMTASRPGAQDFLSIASMGVG